MRLAAAYGVRPEDKATVALVIESLEAANIGSKYGVIINKVLARDYTDGSGEKKEQFKNELFRGLAPSDR